VATSSSLLYAPYAASYAYGPTWSPPLSPQQMPQGVPVRLWAPPACPPNQGASKAPPMYHVHVPGTTWQLQAPSRIGGVSLPVLVVAAPAAVTVMLTLGCLAAFCSDGTTLIGGIRWRSSRLPPDIDEGHWPHPYQGKEERNACGQLTIETMLRGCGSWSLDKYDRRLEKLRGRELAAPDEERLLSPQEFIDLYNQRARHAAEALAEASDEERKTITDRGHAPHAISLEGADPDCCLERRIEGAGSVRNARSIFEGQRAKFAVKDAVGKPTTRPVQAFAVGTKHGGGVPDHYVTIAYEAGRWICIDPALSHRMPLFEEPRPTTKGAVESLITHLGSGPVAECAVLIPRTPILR